MSRLPAFGLFVNVATLLVLASITPMLIGLAGSSPQQIGDVDNDGRVGVLDAELILQYAAGIIPALPTVMPHPTPTRPPTATATVTPVPTPARGGDLSRLPLPSDFSINYTGCTRNGPPECIPAGAIAFYSIGTHEAVMPPGSAPGSEVELHETCHGHEDWTTMQAGVPFGDWMTTDEGRSFLVAEVAETGIWGFFGTLETKSPIEFFAQMCAVWYHRPNDLAANGPVMYHWFEEHLP